MHGFSNYMRDTRKKVDALSQRIADLNPDNILERGYSITQRKDTGEIVFDSTAVEKADNLIVSLSKGKLEVTVTDTHQ